MEHLSREREEVSANYVSKGFMGRVGMGKKPCVLIVDLNKGFTDPTTGVGSDQSELIRQVNRVLESARQHRVKIIYTSLAYSAPEEAGLWVKKIPALKELLIGSGLEEIDERLNRQPNEQVIYKRYASSFAGTPLLHELVCDGIDTLIILGVSTSGCIRATAIDALEHGFHAIVPREGVGDRAQAPHENNLFDIDAKYGDVVSMEEVLQYIRTL